ncbi:MAG: DUF86 domain-containing protein [Thermodesulfobacteriota bacterium]
MDNLELAAQFAGGMSYEDFCQDTKTVYAVIRCLEVMGEAAKNIPTATRRKYPDIPWKEMAGMRDKLIHGYSGVDSQKVWMVIQNYFPRLKKSIGEMLQDLKISL